ncbi:hypothetical protein [Aneurinibacillus tyrosinisolvens]|uniref:hypothetical protein n=1 Tax=Aneurinibacillus tyrosinisolvens TaxID=1443435 RepID=UPI00063F9A6C|nr:hypothetical protein [Aneurinibacillus tyrosinisolvens]
MDRLIRFIIAVIIGYIITNGTYNIFASSLFNSVPILGDVLTGFDIAYIMQNTHAGMELSEAANVMVSVLVWYFFNIVLEGIMHRENSRLFITIQVISFYLLNLIFLILPIFLFSRTFMKLFNILLKTLQKHYMDDPSLLKGLQKALWVRFGVENKSNKHQKRTFMSF